ncbi:MAG TPA: hypothetical protein P5267_01990 [Patescibacteria group bacterium]|nr:hypothetical protein [Patescibacteria group bacterium]
MEKKQKKIKKTEQKNLTLKELEKFSNRVIFPKVEGIVDKNISLAKRDLIEAMDKRITISEKKMIGEMDRKDDRLRAELREIKEAIIVSQDKIVGLLKDVRQE